MIHFIVGILLTARFAPATAELISRSRPLRNGETLLSAGGSFEMGFLTLRKSHERYLAIWFTKSEPTLVVWIANKDKPLHDSAGVLLVDDNLGNLLLLDRPGGVPVWSTPRLSHNSGGNSNSVAAELLDSGNLVLRARGKNSPVLWQSIDEPQNVMLPGMKLTAGKTTGAGGFLTSWKSADDPSPGNFTFKMDFSGVLPRLILYEGSAIRYSTGHYNGFRFTGIPSMQPNSIVRYLVKITVEKVEYSFEMKSNSTSSVLALNTDGVARRLILEEGTRNWRIFTISPVDVCDHFANCGSFGICNMSNIPVCGCMEGYAPRDGGNAGGGCERVTAAVCGGGGKDGFQVFQQLKLPHLVNAKVDSELSLEQCRERCAADCSCAAFAAANVSDPRGGCISWHGELLDIRVLDTKVEDLFIRVPASSQMKELNVKTKAPRKILTLFLYLLLPGLVLALLSFYILRRKTNSDEEERSSMRLLSGMHKSDEETTFFPLHVLASATGDFSPENKIGEGGFGVVYKGVLPDGREVAVKRLTTVSMEGQSEFTNEVESLAKLQHRNLVQLLGCCVAAGEKMLVYEYMKNKSLDAFIFDEQKRMALDWHTRLDIVLGVARGLEYLHHDSGSRIIHRDLKAWNILLDEKMVPKISDFGSARIFSADQTLAKTRRIIGTYGYMSPEYAMNGVISMKSDVFSFGVLVLEILAGVRNRSAFVANSGESLLTKAWRLWKEGNCAELLDKAPTDPCPVPDVLRCIHVALLCVQERATNRPTMAEVAMMLSTYTYPIPEPRRPGFVIFRNPKNATVSVSLELPKQTGNELTITDLVGR